MYEDRNSDKNRCSNNLNSPNQYDFTSNEDHNSLSTDKDERRTNKMEMVKLDC